MGGKLRAQCGGWGCKKEGNGCSQMLNKNNFPALCVHLQHTHAGGSGGQRNGVWGRGKGLSRKYTLMYIIAFSYWKLKDLLSSENFAHCAVMAFHSEGCRVATRMDRRATAAASPTRLIGLHPKDKTKLI